MLFFSLGPNQEKLGSGYLTHQAQNYNGEIGQHIKSNFNRLYLDFPTLQVFCDLIENFLPSLNFFLCFTFFPIASNVRVPKMFLEAINQGCITSISRSVYRTESTLFWPNFFQWPLVCVALPVKKWQSQKYITM